MVRESTDKEGGREVVGKPDGKGRGHPHLADQHATRPMMDHGERKSAFHKIGERESTRREDGHRGGGREKY